MSGIDASGAAGDTVDTGSAALHDAVAHALGLDQPEFHDEDLVEERPPISPTDVDDGTNEAIRMRHLLSFMTWS